ncbi:MAG: hypothetical protein LRZ93_02300 [Clostridiales bacterium]|nr:hypothetical protein [Clostridiales bacterium]
MNRSKILRFLLLLSITFLIMGCNNDKGDYLKHSDGSTEIVDKSNRLENTVDIKELEPKQEDEVEIDLPKIDIYVECNKNKEGYLEYVHKTKETSFSFVHPEDWFFEEDDVWDAGMASDGHLREASPERGGVRFLLDRETEGLMIIDGSFTKFIPPRPYGAQEFVEKDLVINGIMSGRIIYERDNDNEVLICISYERKHLEGEGFYSPSIYMIFARFNKEFYHENKDTIWEIIGSVDFKFIKEESK